VEVFANFASIPYFLFSICSLWVPDLGAAVCRALPHLLVFAQAYLSSTCQMLHGDVLHDTCRLWPTQEMLV
jgi:hypothetical protein